MSFACVPSFLSLHYTALHWPWETRDDAGKAPQVKDNLFNLAGRDIHVYRRMDEGIGWVMAALEPERLAAMREAWLAWNGTISAIPADATVSLGYSVKDMPQR